MAKYELSDQQVRNLKAIIMDANIKGEVAPMIIGLLQALDNPVHEVTDSDLHSEHNDSKE